jgi:hypothetical protein
MIHAYQDRFEKASRARTSGRKFLSVASMLAVLLFLGVLMAPTGVSAEGSSYTIASLEGDYGFVGTYSGDAARLVGTAHFDGRGNMTNGSARVVISTGVVKAVTYNGVYTMNSDGTGTIAVTVYGVGAPPPTVNLDFVITKAKLTNGIKVATEVMDAQEEPSVVVVDQPSFVVHTFTRRPDDEERH